MSDLLAINFTDTIAKAGNRVYLGAGFDGVEAIDVTDPLHPEQSDWIWFDDIVVDVTAAGNTLAVSGENGDIELFRVTDTTADSQGFYAPYGWIDDTAIHGAKLWIRQQSGGIEVADISDPAHARRVTTLPSSSVRDVTARYGATIAAMPGASRGIEVYAVTAR